ncbi:MAG: 50S ribosomal protein L15 [Dehalococcoidia bacterium]|nr:50S ribosomal protein L15 [Dehalococcoidia bacterium]MDH4291296.1 50S ribosomal protein L15 [Dehalococcoidia bacterium]
MKQNELKPSTGAKHKRKFVGRGNGSGHGTYSGRGCKGQKARSGGGVRLGFEGGQLALIKRLPRKRGFTNLFKTEYNIVNVGQLAIFSPGSEVTPKELLRAGLINTTDHPTKILGTGDIKHPLLVSADKFSSSAENKIVAAGGSIKQA